MIEVEVGEVVGEVGEVVAEAELQVIAEVAGYGGERTETVYAGCRDAGFEGVNVDLVYGLPGQTFETFTDTLRGIIELQPDRVACFSYAHVPWVRPNQELVDTTIMLTGYEKFQLFQLTVETGKFLRGQGSDSLSRPFGINTEGHQLRAHLLGSDEGLQFLDLSRVFGTLYHLRGADDPGMGNVDETERRDGKADDRRNGSKKR